MLVSVDTQLQKLCFFSPQGQRLPREMRSALSGRASRCMKTFTCQPAGQALTGFSVVAADDLDAALEIAKACPFCQIGTIEVAQTMQMQP